MLPPTLHAEDSGSRRVALRLIISNICKTTKSRMNWITVSASLMGCIIASNTGVSSATLCTEEAIKSCVEPSREKLAKHTNGSIFPYYTDEEFLEMCQDYDVYKNCLEPFRDTCNPATIVIFENEENAYGYACGEGAEAYTNNNECYLNQRTDLQLGGEICQNSFLETKQLLDTLLTTALEIWKRGYCAALNSMANCRRAVIKSHCNDELATWQYTFDKKLMGRPSEKLFCNIEYIPDDEADWTRPTNIPPTPSPTTLRPGSSCTATNIVECLSSFASYLQSVSGGSQVQWYDQQQLSEICRRHKDTQACYSAFADSCDLETKQQFGNIGAAYDYVCKEGPQVYNKSSECYLDPKLDMSLVECSNNSEAQRYDIDASFSSCGWLNDLFRCLTEAFYATKVCSQESIKFQLTLNLLMIAHKNCTVHEQCAESREGRCLQLLDRHFTGYQKEFPVRSSGDIANLCRARAEKDVCMAPFAQYCPVRDRKVLRGFNEAARYICEDGGKAAYLQHMSCLSKAVRTETSRCYSRGMNTVNAIEDRPEFPSITPELQQDYCRAIIDDLLGCVRGVLSQSCHRDMVEYQYTVDSLVWKPSLNRSGCETSRETSPATDGPPTPSTLAQSPDNPDLATTSRDVDARTTNVSPTSTTYNDPGSASFLSPFIAIYVGSLLLSVREIAT